MRYSSEADSDASDEVTDAELEAVVREPFQDRKPLDDPLLRVALWNLEPSNKICNPWNLFRHKKRVMRVSCPKNNFKFERIYKQNMTAAP